MESLVYMANGMYLASYFMKDMLHLRILTVTAALCLVAYFYFRPEPMMTVVCWNLFFVALNVFQIIRIVASRTETNVPDTDQSMDPNAEFMA
jgi:hypothetical protein